MMDDMSPDYGTGMKCQWKTYITVVSKYDLLRAYNARGEVTECSPYDGIYTWGRNE